MNHRQSLKLNMLMRVDGTLGKYAEVFVGIKPMAGAVTEYRQTIIDVQNAATERLAVSVPTLTLEKRRSEGAMIDLGVQVANALYVLGFETDNSELLNMLGVSESSFYRLTDSNKVPLAQRVLVLAQKYQTEVADYGCDEAKITEFKAAIADYNKLVVAPMNAITVRKQKTTNIKELFARLDSILYDRLDRLMVLFKKSHPDFYQEYRTARNIIEVGK
jgi:hypothetical protein